MASKRLSPEELRSFRWYGPHTRRAFAHRQRTLQMGFRRKDFMGKPVIGILNTWSELSTCHYHLRERAQDVKRGIWSAGGFPIELPAMGLGEVMVKPSTMYYRNFLAMEVEENLRCHPIDGVVLMGGCDKTTVGLLMGAFSVNLPAIFLPAGPMLSGRWRNQIIGVGTHTMKYWDELRAGTITEEDWLEIEAAMCRSNGTCNTMGTASTMTTLTEALGMTLPGATTIPAVDSAHPRLAADCGERIVEMVWQDMKPSSFLTKRHFLNAVTTHMGISGSTNAAIHLIAIAGRLGIPLNLEDMDAVSRKIPVIVDMMPAGRFLMEDLHYAGGIPAVLSRLRDHLNLDCVTVNGKTLGDNIAKAQVFNDEVIRDLKNPVTAGGSLAVLRGNLAPNGAVIKPSAATPELMRFRGRALVFASHAEMNARIDDPALEVDANTVLVLQGAGPVGAPGMPEWGGLPIPKKLLQQGVRDMVRISDARMSGTHYGTVVLHVSPESAVGGPLALVRTGDWIALDVEARTLNLEVDDAELARRRAEWKKPVYPEKRGYGLLYRAHVTQAERGCDFDFLEGSDPLPEPDIY